MLTPPNRPPGGPSQSWLAAIPTDGTRTPDRPGRLWRTSCETQLSVLCSRSVSPFGLCYRWRFALGWLPVVVIPAGAPHPEAARALVDRLVAAPVRGRITPLPELKVMAADITRFAPPVAESPIGPEGVPVAPEAADELLPPEPPTAAPTAAPSAARKPRKAKP